MSASDFLKAVMIILDGLGALFTLSGMAIKAAAAIAFPIIITKLVEKWLDKDDDDSGSPP